MKPLKIPSSLVSSTWLSENQNHPNLIVLDATIPKVGQAAPKADEVFSAIKNTRFFDLKNIFKDQNAVMPNTFPSPNYFEKEVQKLGINENSVLVIYDRHGVYSSPRAWFLFKAMGHQQVAVLNGGLPGWQREERPVDTLSKYDGVQGNFKAKFQEKLVVDFQYVLDSINDENQIVLDARSTGRFHATAPEPRADLRGGHIPKSKSLPHTTVVQEGQMLSAEALKEIFKQLDLDDKTLTFSCGSGITACVLALAADQAGYEDYKVYDGSWTEWASNLDLPIAVE